jgi:hypothetical protein
MANNISYIPNGPKNLATVFPTIDFGDVAEYYIEVVNPTGIAIATTTLNQIQCCCSEDKVRLVFLNYLGTYDAVNFIKPKVLHETTSSEYEKGLPNILLKTSTGSERFNIKSNDTYETKTNCYNENDMLWLQELADSPKVFIEWKGTQGQPDSFLPVILTSKKFEKVKQQNDFKYEFVVEFKLSNEYFTIRN